MNENANETKRAIGVFDSGLGGLTAVKELKRILPAEDIVYFGDTGRVPYGTRGKDIIINYSRQDMAFLLSKNVKIILAACNTVSSTYPVQNAKNELPVPYVEVVNPAARAAAAATKNGRVGIIGTEATHSSGSYRRAFAAINPEIKCFENSCPLFVPLVENGHFEKGDKMALLAAEEYLAPLKKQGIDTLVLGCTHYPLLADAISDYMGGGVTLVDSGKQAAAALKTVLTKNGLVAENQTESTAGKNGSCEYYVSDDPERFGRLAGLFLNETPPPRAEWVNIEKYKLDWILKGWLPGLS